MDRWAACDAAAWIAQNESSHTTIDALWTYAKIGEARLRALKQADQLPIFSTDESMAICELMFDFELWAKAPNGLEFEFLHRADTMFLNIGHMCTMLVQSPVQISTYLLTELAAIRSVTPVPAASLNKIGIVAAELQAANFRELTAAETTVTLINVHNALVLHALLAMDARRREAVFRTKLGRAEFRVSHKYRIGKRLEMCSIALLADSLLHEQFDVDAEGQMYAARTDRAWDRRIAFALSLAHKDSPDVRVYAPSTLDEQLDGALHRAVALVSVDLRTNEVVLPHIFKKTRHLFGSTDQAVLEAITPFLQDAPRAALERYESNLKIRIPKADYTLQLLQKLNFEIR